MKFSALIAALAVTMSGSLAAVDRVFPARSLPKTWAHLSSAVVEPSKTLSLRIALHPKDGKRLEASLLDVATPGSKRFRKYLKKDQITAIVGRDDRELNELKDYFAKHGLKVSSVHPHKDWIFVEGSASNVENLFKCKLEYFQHRVKQEKRIAAIGGYSVPGEISHLVNFVAGMSTFSFGHLPTTPVVGSSVTDVTSKVTPQTIYDNYGVPSTGSSGSKLGSQAVIEFGALANFNTADLQTFFHTYQPALAGEECTMVYGTNNGDVRPSVEANLDVQYIMAAGPYVNTTDYKLVSSEGIEDQFLDYTIMVNGEYQPPLVHSISYGEYGGSYDNVTDQQFSYELQKMGLAGISVLLASGDNGVGCNADGSSQEFDYPSSPFITMVGATQINAVTGKEEGATLSSGGFSLDFWQADWQADAVKGYFNSGVSLPAEYYFPQGRAYPDVAAYGQNVQVTASGKTQSVAGTSCSAPIFAGVVALLNDELMKAGEAPLGFLNPWMYANPTMFTDITAGSNPYEKCAGFQAAAGWDPVTGLGTPIYSKMRTAAFAALQK